MPIATLEELKEYLSLDEDPGDDDFLTSVLERVSQRVESYTGRLFHPDPPLDSGGADTADPVDKSVRLRRRPGDLPHAPFYVEPVQWRRPRTINIPDAREITTITFQGETVTGWEAIDSNVAAGTFDRLDLFGLVITPPPSTSRPKLTITGRFGIWPVPEDLKDAFLIMAARRYRERDAGYADALVLPDAGVVNYFKQFSPTVQSTLENYRRRERLA